MLTSKTMLVTGSSRGIGAAIAKLATENGASVIPHDQSVFDVRYHKSVERVVAGWEPIDILVNNAGINPSKTFFDLTSEDWQSIFDTNLFGVVNVSRAVLPRMMERKRGVIVNIASIKGFAHVAGKPAYAASKAAVIQLTARMAEEFAPHGIRINAVAPGFTLTEMTQKSFDQEQALGKTTLSDQIKKIPMRRMATPEEIAEAVIFLASDRASYITGQCLAVDGGLSIV